MSLMQIFNKPVLREKDDFNSLDYWLNSPYLAPLNSELSGYIMPNVKVKTDETDTEFIIVGELAGFTKEEVKIDIKDNLLTISAQKKEQNKNNYFASQFHKSFSLPQNINLEKATADLADGILKLILPKQEPTNKVKQILIK